ncbi:15517_t:CDS:2 [Entrophospora sp. SA101]|nr:15517_t:CDS:2 [Entrophospora sp. SA101]CAJ0874489.1 17183_t:CDS:2 [Entrophospora sp. SA101]
MAFNILICQRSLFINNNNSSLPLISQHFCLKKSFNYKKSSCKSPLKLNYVHKIYNSTPSSNNSSLLVKEKPISKKFYEIINSIKVGDGKEVLTSATKVLNDFTGYSVVEDLKKKVIQQENKLAEARKQLEDAKLSYENAISIRSNTQREVSELLQRKHLWTNDDVIRFTELYRNEHLNEQKEVAAKDEFHKCEKMVETGYTELTRMMMMRYHEEQVWSDKIRSASTYGTISLILLNFILFICVQTVFEPRKRQKLADKFEELLIVRSNEEEGRLKNDIFQLLKEQLQKLEKRFNELLNVSTITTATLPSSLISNEPKDIIIEQETAVKDNEQGVNNNPDEIEAINYSDSSSTLNLIKQNNPKIVHLSTDELENITIISAILGASVGILLSLAFNEIFRR